MLREAYPPVVGPGSHVHVAGCAEGVLAKFVTYVCVVEVSCAYVMVRAKFISAGSTNRLFQ